MAGDHDTNDRADILIERFEEMIDNQEEMLRALNALLEVAVGDIDSNAESGSIESNEEHDEIDTETEAIEPEDDEIRSFY